MKAAILQTLQTHQSLTFTELANFIEGQLAGNFDGSVSWYVVTVKLDLEARDIIERVPKTHPQKLQLVSRC